MMVKNPMIAERAIIGFFYGTQFGTLLERNRVNVDVVRFWKVEILKFCGMQFGTLLERNPVDVDMMRL